MILEYSTLWKTTATGYPMETTVAAKKNCGKGNKDVE